MEAQWEGLADQMSPIQQLRDHFTLKIVDNILEMIDFTHH